MENDYAKQVTVTVPAPKKKRGWLIFLIITVLIIFGAILFGFLISDWNGHFMPSSPYIAKLSVEGTIGADTTDFFGTPVGYQHSWTMNQVDDLIKDRNNKGIILFVNSPGGGVYESDELYLKLKEYKEKTGRPVYAVMGPMAASGGYYVSASADRIIANRNTITGSIGVAMGTYFDLSGFLSKYGINAVAIHSGANKEMGSMVSPMTDEQKAILQSLCDEAYDQFTSVVAESRDMDIARVKQLADGRVYTANQALKLGLVDEIGTMDDAISEMDQIYGLDHCKVIDLKDEKGSLFSSMLSGKALGKLLQLNNGKNGDFSAVMNFVEEKNKFPISYLYEGMN